MTERITSEVYTFAYKSRSCLNHIRSLHKSIAKWHRAYVIQLEPEYFKFREWCVILGVQEIEFGDRGPIIPKWFEDCLSNNLRFDNERIAGIILGYLVSLNGDLADASEDTGAPQSVIPGKSGIVQVAPVPSRTKSISRLFRHRETVPEESALTKTKKPSRVTVGEKWQTMDKQSFMVLLDTLTKVNAALIGCLGEEDRVRVGRRVQASLLCSQNLQVKAIDDCLPQEREIQTLAAIRDELKRERQAPRDNGFGKHMASAIPPVKIIDIAEFDDLAEGGRSREMLSLGGGERVLVEWNRYRDQEDLTKLMAQGNLVGLFNFQGTITLPSKGIVVDKEENRTGLVYKIPKGYHEPVTLLEILGRGPLSLGLRYRMTKKLAASVNLLLLVGWFHKTLECESLICFEEPRKQPAAGSVLLCGPAAVQVCLMDWNSLNSGSETESDLIYAFGLILLQVGLWRPLSVLQEGSNSDEEFQEKVKGELCDSLLYTTGEIYWRATKRCLNMEFDREEKTGKNGRQITLSAAFERQVLSELEQCVA